MSHHPPPPDISTIFGEVLHDYRSTRDISQEELAFEAGVDRTFISRLERGIRQPTITTLIGLGQAFNVSAADMVLEAEKRYLQQVRDGQGEIKEKPQLYSSRMKRQPQKR
ncbi:MAG: helix-turn-helix domain-containing protein [Pseudomonadales bacterium]|jgi:transcriptional regulator with XRE-family HTH domain|nr:helix-turn-helix domain-containing protein [Pseudomonadales bacterium]